jgi:N-acetylglucosamine-6-phosphate deacetylase
MPTTYTNARVFTGSEVLERATVHVEQGRVVHVESSAHSHVENTQVIDCQGILLAPALIDLQVYGGGGKLFNNEPTAETIQKTWETVRAGGSSHFQITLSSSPLEVVWQAIEACRDYWARGGQGLLGLHLEGPYFHPEKRGAHPLAHIRRPHAAEVAVLIERGRGVVRYLTLAPEMTDDASLDLLLQSGILLSAGHSNATFEEAARGFAKGIGRVTHLFNAMSAFQGRAPGLVGATYAHKPWASIIADGVHCDYNSLKISKEILGDRLFLISDAVTESLVGNYRFRFAGDRYVDDAGTLAGSSLSMWQAVQNAVRHAGIPLAEALRMASTYPAEVVEEGHRLGKIAPGYAADFVFFNDRMELVSVSEK